MHSSTVCRRAGLAKAHVAFATYSQAGSILSYALAALVSSRRVASRLMRQLASLCWIAWKCPMNSPNCLRTLACSTASSKERLAAP